MDIAFNGPRRNCERSCQYCFNHEKNIDMDDFELTELLHSNRTECPHRDPSYGTPELSGFDAHSVLGSHLPEAPYERSMDPHDLLDNIASHQPRDYLYQFTSPLQNEVDIEKTNENELSSFTSTIAATECERPSPTDFNPLQRLDTGMIPKEYSTQESPSSMNNQPLGNSISIVPDHDFILYQPKRELKREHRFRMDELSDRSIFSRHTVTQERGHRSSSYDKLKSPPAHANK